MFKRIVHTESVTHTNVYHTGCMLNIKTTNTSSQHSYYYSRCNHTLHIETYTHAYMCTAHVHTCVLHTLSTLHPHVYIHVTHPLTAHAKNYTCLFSILVKLLMEHPRTSHKNTYSCMHSYCTHTQLHILMHTYMLHTLNWTHYCWNMLLSYWVSCSWSIHELHIETHTHACIYCTHYRLDTHMHTHIPVLQT